MPIFKKLFVWETGKKSPQRSLRGSKENEIIRIDDLAKSSHLLIVQIYSYFGASIVIFSS